MTKAWHFLKEDGTMRNGEKPPRVGEWLTWDGPLVMCKSGLHSSRRAIDALKYAHGPTVCRVIIDGETIRDTDKQCSRRRKILWRYDATDVLRHFACLRALDVTDRRKAPELVVRYLCTRDEAIRDAAMAAAKDAAWAATREAQNKRLTRMLLAGRPQRATAHN